ncbi:hypothetical protein [Rossellomorea aquimaris]|uniref:hypothetical protein n=1 Tax=Rossellomorea aquimaris TaxID=189382 RepID=UPI0011E8A3D0|nr:hypothetical protein [Rossellomorea aquimaris]TYS91941.1 hypothetical protein FZC88_07340 [Rossellomorea aquimaris]
MEIYPGDIIVTDKGTYLLLSAEGFDLIENVFDSFEVVKYILVNVKFGSMEAYDFNLESLLSYYEVREVIPNLKSQHRLKEESQ